MEVSIKLCYTTRRSDNYSFYGGDANDISFYDIR